LPTNPNSAFSTTSIKPALGSSFTFFVDITLLLQDSSKVFPMDEGERERARSKDGGMRGVAEVLKNRFGVNQNNEAVINHFSRLVSG
jgi:hypothetical protein